MQASFRKSKVIIADDHPVSLSGLKFLVSTDPAVEIVATAKDGREALQLCEKFLPDILLLDLMLPEIDGLEILRSLKQSNNSPLVIVISGQVSGLNFKRAVDLGAQGVVSKEDAPEEILSAIDRVRNGKSFLSKKVREFILPLVGSEQMVAPELAELTPRERQVLALVGSGKTNEDISSELNMALGTAKKHREHIHRKLGISTAVEATHMAAKFGLIKL